MQRAFFTIGTLNLNHGGLTKALLVRARVFAEMGIEVTILTTEYREKHAETMQELRKSAKLHPAVHVRNYWTELVSEPLTSKRTHHQDDIDENAVVIRSAKSEDVFVNGLRVCRRTLDAKHNATSADYFDRAGRRIEVASFWPNRTKRRSLIYFPDGKSVSRECHFDANGNCRISVEYDERHSPILVHVWTSISGQTFPNMTAPLAEWVNSIVRDGDTVFADVRAFDGLVLLLRPSIRKVAVAHMNHLGAPHTDITVVSGGYRDLFRQEHRFDLIALLTPEQRQDAGAIGHPTERMKVLPNLPAVPRSALAPKEGHYIVICARYAHQKRLDDALRVLKLVFDANPAMRADIFGQGEEKQNLVSLCRELGLTDVVRINDYTPSPLDVLAKAQCTIMTSRHEGLPLSLQESLSVGTPPVSYDIRYGPAHLIEDGVNGYLVADGDIAGMANRVITLLENPGKARTMAEAALASSHRFSESAYTAAWRDALHAMSGEPVERTERTERREPGEWFNNARKWFTG